MLSYEKLLNNISFDVKKKRIPTPAYFHDVGDRVFYGAWDYTEILDSHEDGKYYTCFSETTKKNTNRGCVYETKVHLEAWYHLKTYKHISDYPDVITRNKDIFFNYSQRSLDGLLMMMFNQYGIDLNPDYQRGNVWDNDQKVNLIDSIFKNIDIGKFTIIKRPWGDNPNKPKTQLLYEMLDGKQRLTAIYEFYIGWITYNGKFFHELHPRDQSHFKNYSISYAETEPMTKKQKYRYFLRLNTTGVPVSKMHINEVKIMLAKEKEGK